MVKFAKLVFAFLLLFTVLVIVFGAITAWVVRENGSFHIKPNPKYIVIGHSHPECAFNDTLIPEFKNISESGESYFYTYYKLKPILKQNPSIEVVLIEFSNNQAEEYIENWIWDEKYLLQRLPRFSSYIDLKSHAFLFGKNSEGYLNAFSVSLKYRVTRILKGDFDFSNEMGGFLGLSISKTDSIVDVWGTGPVEIDTLKIEPSAYNLRYLSQIIELCESFGKQVVLIRSPLHSLYMEHQDEAHYQQIRKNYFSGIEYLDFSRFPIPNSGFADLEHLNKSGARHFSLWFAGLLKKGILEKKHMQDFVIKEMEVYKLHKKAPGVI